jgi:3-oxoacyl-(acyl-carrier-protein) synthase
MGLNPVPELETYLNSNSSKVNLVNNPYDIHSLYLAEKFKAGAFQKSILTACVSSTQAIALGYESILNKEAKVVIAGGTDSLVNLVPLTSFGKLGVIPETATGTECTPFDRNRNGTLAGEAAGFVILASEEFINQNNIQPLGQIMGYGNSLDGYKITAPDPSGISMTKAIENALSNSGLKSSQIDYINAHGTGTRHNDELELRCIGKALGEDAKRIPISSTKDRHGHAIAAAGIQELCLLLELMKHETMPSNLKLKSPCSEEFNLLRENKKKKITYALTNNFAFGGINTVLAIKNERI